MKYKVLKDYPTTDGVLYEKGIVKVSKQQMVMKLV